MLEESIREIVREEIAAALTTTAPHEWYDADEAATYLRISRAQVHNLTSTGALPRHGAKGTKLRFLRADLDAYAAGRWSR